MRRLICGSDRPSTACKMGPSSREAARKDRRCLTPARCTAPSVYANAVLMSSRPRRGIAEGSRDGEMVSTRRLAYRAPAERPGRRGRRQHRDTAARARARRRTRPRERRDACDALAEARRPGGVVSLGLAALEFMDLAGLHVLLDARFAARLGGGELRVRVPQPRRCAPVRADRHRTPPGLSMAAGATAWAL